MLRLEGVLIEVIGDLEAISYYTPTATLDVLCAVQSCTAQSI